MAPTNIIENENNKIYIKETDFKEGILVNNPYKSFASKSYETTNLSVKASFPQLEKIKSGFISKKEPPFRKKRVL